MIPERLMEMRVGLLLGLLTLVYGFGLGVSFGAREEAIMDHLRANGVAVLEPVYHSDEAALDKVLSTSWGCFKRAHLHANGLGTTAIALILVLAAVSAERRINQVAALALGLGALGYAFFWMLAGLRAPGLGGADAAEASLGWLAIPSAGLCVIGLLVTIGLVVKNLYGRRTPSSS